MAKNANTQQTAEQSTINALSSRVDRLAELLESVSQSQIAISQTVSSVLSQLPSVLDQLGRSIKTEGPGEKLERVRKELIRRDAENEIQLAAGARKFLIRLPTVKNAERIVGSDTDHIHAKAKFEAYFGITGYEPTAAPIVTEVPGEPTVDDYPPIQRQRIRDAESYAPKNNGKPALAAS